MSTPPLSRRSEGGEGADGGEGEDEGGGRKGREPYKTTSHSDAKPA